MLIVFFVRLNLLGQDGGHQEEDAGHEGGEGQRLRQVWLEETVGCPWQQGVTKRCRLSWLTNSTLLYEPKCVGGGGGGGCGVSAKEYSCAHGAQINFRDLTPHLKKGLSSIFLYIIILTRHMYFMSFLDAASQNIRKNTENRTF
jgi:hypothetical protein